MMHSGYFALSRRKGRARKRKRKGERPAGCRNRMNFVLDIIRGMVIGVANIIPGVSGGTMMVTMGIYDKLLEAINGFFKHFKKSIRILLPYIIGMAIGIVAFAYLLTDVLFAKFPLPTSFAFVGLILGGIPMLVANIKKAGKNHGPAENIPVFVCLAALIVGMQFLGEKSAGALTPSFGLTVILFFIGVLAASAMVIPGVSGSLLLLALGYYNGITGAITDFISAGIHMEWKTVFTNFAILFPFGLGVLGGIFFVAKLIEWLLRRHEKVTYFGILGLVVASPVPVIWKAIDQFRELGGKLSALTVIMCVLTMAAGVAVAVFMGKDSKAAGDKAANPSK